jgi:hypothetical protein
MKTTADREGGVSRKRRSHTLERASHCGAELYGAVRCGFVAENVVAVARFRLIVRLWFHFRTLNAAGLARSRSPATVVRGTRSRPITCAWTEASAAGGIGSVAASAPPHFGGARGRQPDFSHTGEVKPIGHE